MPEPTRSERASSGTLTAGSLHLVHQVKRVVPLLPLALSRCTGRSPCHTHTSGMWAKPAVGLLVPLAAHCLCQAPCGSQPCCCEMRCYFRSRADTTPIRKEIVQTVATSTTENTGSNV